MGIHFFPPLERIIINAINLDSELIENYVPIIIGFKFNILPWILSTGVVTTWLSYHLLNTPHVQSSKSKQRIWKQNDALNLFIAKFRYPLRALTWSDGEHLTRDISFPICKHLTDKMILYNMDCCINSIGNLKENILHAFWRQGNKLMFPHC